MNPVQICIIFSDLDGVCYLLFFFFGCGWVVCVFTVAFGTTLIEIGISAIGCCIEFL